MILKKVHDFEAPKKQWSQRTEECATCRGKGKVVNEAADGIEDCPDCEAGVRTIPVPPLLGIEVEGYGDEHHFSPRLVERGRQEGWLSMDKGGIVIDGLNVKLTYAVKRIPGLYDGEQINYYDCELVEATEVDNG